MATDAGSDEALREYRRKRDAARTPEPVPPPPGAEGDGARPDGSGTGGNTFVIQEHHARALHWDFRLERDGVLVSWAVPKNLPADPRTNHLAVHTEDHPLEYADFAGDIPAGEYGGGAVTIWDRGTYTSEKWTDTEVKVVLNGQRIQGRYVLFQTRGKDWMVHRMDPPSRPDWTPLPDLVRPMLAVLSTLPEAAQDDRWAYETKWDGVRAVAYVEGGRLVRLLSRNDRDLARSYPELRPLGAALGSTQAVLDGEIVAFHAGRSDFGRLQRRMHVEDPAQARRLAGVVPVVYLVFDVLHLDGRSTTGLPYSRRRDLLESLKLSGPAWQTPPYFIGGGADVLRASQENGLEGIVAKRLSSVYRPGARTPDWRKIKNVRTQEVVVVGWKPGAGRRAGRIGSLVLAVNGEAGLVYAGGVGTGFTDAMLDDLAGRLDGSEQGSCPLAADPPRAQVRDVRWVEPRLVGEVAFAEWTSDGRLRHPSWRGLRPDKGPDDVRRES